METATKRNLEMSLTPLAADQPGYYTHETGAGDDYLHGGGGNDLLFGQAGNDVLIARATDRGAIADVVFLHGGTGDSTLESSNGNDLLDGAPGNGPIRMAGEMLRSTGKISQKRNASGAANNEFWRRAA